MASAWVHRAAYLARRNSWMVDPSWLLHRRQQTGCGLVPPSDAPEALFEALVQLAADPERRRQMGAAGRRAFREQYNWSRQEEHLLSVYRQRPPAKRRPGTNRVPGVP